MPASMSHTVPHLPTEVWLQVVSHLHQNVPVPDGRAAARDIRQRDLAALMFVSKTFYSMVAPILYDKVITDDLSLLLIGSDDERHIAHLPSKRDLILSIRSLHLEYRADDSSNADRASVFYSPDRWRGTRSNIATAEARRTELALHTLANIVIHGKSRLQTISSGSFLGGRDAHWEMCEIQGGRQAIAASKRALLELLQTIGYKGFCQRGAIFRAPIATSSSAIESDAAPIERAPIVDFHDEDVVPSPGPSTIWYIEADRFSDSIAAREMGRNSGEPMMLLGMYANYYNHNRLVGLAQGEGDVARLKGYVSRVTTPRDSGKSTGQKDRYIAQIREHVNLRLLKALGYSPKGYKWADVEQDTVQWETMDVAPACRGCGWAARDSEIQEA